MLGEISGEILVPSLEQHGEVASVDDSQAPGTGSPHQPSETGIQFRCAAGEVQGRKRQGRQALEDEVYRCLVHDLGALRAGIDVAVQALLVAPVTEVDLQRVWAAASQRGKI